MGESRRKMYSSLTSRTGDRLLGYTLHEQLASRQGMFLVEDCSHGI